MVMIVLGLVGLACLAYTLRTAWPLFPPAYRALARITMGTARFLRRHRSLILRASLRTATAVITASVMVGVGMYVRNRYVEAQALAIHRALAESRAQEVAWTRCRDDILAQSAPPVGGAKSGVESLEAFIARHNAPLAVDKACGPKPLASEPTTTETVKCLFNPGC